MPPRSSRWGSTRPRRCAASGAPRSSSPPNLVRDGDADAVVSAGSTGATMAAAVFRLGRIHGIDRPALPAHMITATGPVMLLDVGANVDSDAENLVQFAAMGAIFAEHVLHVANPRIGLLNIGEEIEKGHAMAREAHDKLSERGPPLRRQRRGARHDRAPRRRGRLRRIRRERGHQVLRGHHQLHLPRRCARTFSRGRSRRWRCWPSSRGSTGSRRASTTSATAARRCWA